MILQVSPVSRSGTCKGCFSTCSRPLLKEIMVCAGVSRCSTYTLGLQKKGYNITRWVRFLTSTLPETNVPPKNWWLECYFPIGEAYFQGAMLVSGRVLLLVLFQILRVGKLFLDVFLKAVFAATNFNLCYSSWIFYSKASEACLAGNQQCIRTILLAEIRLTSWGC